MNTSKWKVNYQIFRQKKDAPQHFQTFSLEVDPNEYVLDGVERIWAYHDRSLTFRHACHHSVCGACGMRVNGVEKLTCITRIRDVTQNGGTIKVEPLRNFPILSDLVVDMGGLYAALESVTARQIMPLSEAPVSEGIGKTDRRSVNGDQKYERLVDCIECGLCISACPVATTTPEYLGPAVLAAAQLSGIEKVPNNVLELVDSAGGVWRCHSAFECTQVCPSNVEPAWRIMDLRKQVVKRKIKRLFRRN
jgi:succinate dehydrogenase / fumarate reductase iron-sulfur subunit